MLLRASLIALFTIIGMGGQFLIRAVLTSHLGPGSQLDIFFLTLGWAGALASAVFQAVALVHAPQTVGAGATPAMRGLSRRTTLQLTIATTLAAGLAALVVAIIGHAEASGVVLLVLMGWGVAGGLALFQRQLLLAWGLPFTPALLALIPAAAILGLAWCRVIDGISGYALVGCLAWMLVAGAGGALLWRAWHRHGVAVAADPQPGAQRRLLTAAAPVFVANWNSQANQRSQDALAAMAFAGGATVFGNAYALARLPQTIADAMFGSTAYASILKAVATADTVGLRVAYRLGLRVHLAVSVPVAGAVVLAGDAATQAVFAHGNCSIEDTRAIATVLWWTAPGMIITSLQSVHAQVLLAHGRTAAVLRVELVFTILSIVFAATLLPFLGLSGIVIGGTVAFIIIQVPMLRLLAATGLRWQDALAELLRACLPLVPALLLGGWVGHLAGSSPWARALVVGATVLAVTLPCSAWAVRRRRQVER